MSQWQLITTLLPELRAYSRSISPDRTTADDLLSDAIERTVRSRSAPRTIEALRPWIFRVIRNLSIDDFRRDRTRREYSEALVRLYVEGDAETPGPEGRLLLRDAYWCLTRKEREVIFLVDIAGYSYAETARIIGVPNGTVMSRLSRARRSLLDIWNGAEDDR